MKRVVLAVVLAACGSVGNMDKMDARPADAKKVDASPDADLRRCDPAKPFDTPVSVDGINTASYEGWPVLSPDELTIYFMSNRGGLGTSGGIDIFVATRASITDPFGTPAPPANVNTATDD